MRYILIGLLVIVGIILLVLFLPAGGRVDIIEGKIIAYARLFGFNFKVYPREKKTVEQKKDKKTNKKAEDRDKEEDSGDKPTPKITFDMVMEYITFAGEALNGLARGIYIPDFMLEAHLHSDDPSKTAVIYGSACGALEVAVPKMERLIKVKHRDIRLYPEFIGETEFNLSLTVMAVPLQLLIVALGLWIKWKKLNRKYKAVRK